MMESICGMQNFYLTTTYLDPVSLFLEKYVCWALRDQKKDDFMAFEQGSMTVAAYAVKFHASAQLVTIEEERI